MNQKWLINQLLKIQVSSGQFGQAMYTVAMMIQKKLVWNILYPLPIFHWLETARVDFMNMWPWDGWEFFVLSFFCDSSISMLGKKSDVCRLCFFVLLFYCILTEYLILWVQYICVHFLCLAIVSSPKNILCVFQTPKPWNQKIPPPPSKKKNALKKKTQTSNNLPKKKSLRNFKTLVWKEYTNSCCINGPGSGPCIYPLVKDHIAIAGIAPCSRGNTSSIRVHFPLLLLIEEILHLFIGSLPYHLQGFIHPR